MSLASDSLISKYVKPLATLVLRDTSRLWISPLAKLSAEMGQGQCSVRYSKNVLDCILIALHYRQRSHIELKWV